MIRTRVLLGAAIAVLLVDCPFSEAAPIGAGSARYTYDNHFFTRLSPGTPFNPGPTPVDVPVQAQGTFTQVWEAQLGDVINEEITSIRATGSFPGFPPVPFNLFAGVEEVPALGPFTGSISSIVNDPATGELISGFRSVSGPFLQILADGTRLYSIQPYTFVASIDSLPLEVGDVLVGTEDVEIHVQAGPIIDPINDPVIGLVLAAGVVEITSVIPEPNTMTMAIFCAGLIVRCRHRRT